MLCQWMPVQKGFSYGIAIHNFLDEGPFRLKVTVGECVCCTRECEDWYYGYSIKYKNVCGIFPRSFIHIMDTASNDEFGTLQGCNNFEPLYSKHPHIVSEVTAVLREWKTIWERLYMTNNPQFKTIEHKMYELMRLRSKILSGTLPVDELKEVKRLVTWNIDVGNKILGLDMVVRDEAGNILNPENTSVIQLFRHHEATQSNLSSPASENHSSYSGISQIHSYSLYLTVRNLACKLVEDVELLLTLYDGKNSRPFSENFVVKCSKDLFFADADKFYQFRALFTDLGSRDLSREKVYLVCYVIRNGAMDIEQNNKNNNKPANPPTARFIRRPYAVSCLNLTSYFTGVLETDEDKHVFLPFIPCEKETLEGTLKRCLSSKEFPTKDSKGQGMVISFKLLNGDLKQVREENPHLVFGNVAVIRKMGFPEVILPGDVRNDLYLTLLWGEFSKSVRSADRSIEVMVTVCNEKGIPIQDGIVIGGGVPAERECYSVVYYHEDKPRWFESIKVTVPIEDFKSSHIKFIFKHRSSSEHKDKNEKPFALSFVKLMQKNGTTLRDEEHELLVYKIDLKKYDAEDISYLTLASTRAEIAEANKTSSTGLNLSKTDLDAVKTSTTGLTLSNKDLFMIQTNVCSTKLTQNVGLLGLLNWTNEPSKIGINLSALMKVDGEEVVKFLQDVLDTLFSILMQNSDSEVYDDMVFHCLLYVIGLVLHPKFLHFQSVLDLYIQESFSATLAYNKLMITLTSYMNKVSSTEKDVTLLNTMKALKYIMRFVTRSRFLFAQLYEGKGQEQFDMLLEQLFRSLTSMMCLTTDSVLLAQAACLKYLPTTIPDIMIVYSPTQLSLLLMELLSNVPSSRLTLQKIMAVDSIVHSPLFLIPECRAILLVGILQFIKHLLETSDEGKYSAENRRYKSKSVAKIVKVLGATTSDLYQPNDDNLSQLELCIKVMSDIMDILFKPEAGSTLNDITEIILTILRTVIQTTISMDRESRFVANLVSVMISIFRQMTAHHYEVYINHFPTRSDLLDFLMEIQLVFKDLVTRPVYPKDWSEMILLQNSVILKALRYFSHTIRDYFSAQFEYQVWNNFFHCAVSFLTQPALQLDAFSQSKRWRILTRYKDMRRNTGFEIRSMWYNLGYNKTHFIPTLVSPFLEMTLIPEEELRKATIPIFFDMMQFEFYSPKDGITDKTHDNTLIKANFSEFENEMIVKLDNLVEGGSGDEQYKDLFHTIMISLCENHSTMRDLGLKFVMTVTRLMERLLEYRCVINDESKENRMSCTVNLLDFYSEINRKEMYIRYVNKLCALHLECENYTEASYTLKLHSKLLSWSDTPLSPLLRSPKYSHCETHRQLKEALYQDMIAYFDKGKMWECALKVCKELAHQYEEEIYDYSQLSTLLRRMSQFYDSIIKQLRPDPEYFRVAYYGKGFPPFLQNKVFIYRGKEYERLSDFCSRTLNKLPNAELMNKLTPPGSDILTSSGQYVQINRVTPIMDERKQRMITRAVNDQILKYHRVNEIQTFRYSRPFYRSESDGDNKNEFANLWLERTVLITSYPLPGILRWFPVTSSETYLISPLKNAIETMQEANKSLKELIVSYKCDSSLPLNPLSMKLNGIVDAAVMGGVNNYEKAFFTTEYIDKHPDDEELIQVLKDLIASQIPLLDIGIQIHGARAPASLAPLQQRLEEQFADMKVRIQQKYGKKPYEIKLDNIRMRRHTTGHVSTFTNNNEDRLSATSTGSAEGRSLRNLVNLASFASTPTLSRMASHSKSSIITSNSLSSSIAMFAGPVLTSNMSPQKFGTIGALSKREKKEKKKRRNRTESKVTIERVSSNTSGNSQWYTVNTESDTSSIKSFPSALASFELTQELTAKRPLRSEAEKRQSQPNSECSFTMDVLSLLENRDSYGTTTDSTASEEDKIPPPLPAKNRELDHSNLVNDTDVNSKQVSVEITDYNELPPPTPPKKPIHRVTSPAP